MANIIENLDLDALKKDDKVFNDLYHHPKLKRILYFFAKKITGDEMRAEDAVVSAFLYLYKAKHKILSAEHLQRYLYLAVKHKSLSLIKEGLPIASIDPLELAEQTASTQLPADTNVLKAEITYEELLDSVYSNLHLVSGLGAELIRLRYQQALTIDQIAQHMGLEKKQVYNNLNKAIAILKKKLTGDGKGKARNIYFWFSLLCILLALFSNYFFFHGDIRSHPGMNKVGTTTDATNTFTLKLLHG